jgi:hypothetical protein
MHRSSHSAGSASNVPIYEREIHILEISKKTPYNSKHQARKAPSQRTQEALAGPPARQKRSTPPRTSTVRPARTTQAETTAMPITVEQEARTCRALSRFSVRHAGLAR